MVLATAGPDAEDARARRDPRGADGAVRAQAGARRERDTPRTPGQCEVEIAALVEQHRGLPPLDYSVEGWEADWVALLKWSQARAEKKAERAVLLDKIEADVPRDPWEKLLRFKEHHDSYGMMHAAGVRQMHTQAMPHMHTRTVRPSPLCRLAPVPGSAAPRAAVISGAAQTILHRS